VVAALGALVATLPLVVVFTRRPGARTGRGAAAPRGALAPAAVVDDFS
jgi:hypothetical protein